MKTHTTETYRPDIDGLRAVAVLLVVASHLKTRISHGGFIGVDVFFVISGYLITSILVRDLDLGRFTITGFYVRRIRRIAPALLGVLIAATITAYFVLYPIVLRDYARSVLATVSSLSNFYFWATTNYFDAQHTNKPLLHTWSLAVEEQFYIFFPPLLALIHRKCKQWMFHILVGIFLISFAISAWTAFTDSSFAFFWPITRAWELLCGSLLALRAIPGMKNVLLRNIAAIAGLVSIGYGVYAYYDYTPFPGIAALPPCLGAVLIIGAGSGGKTLAGRLLSFKPVVFIGLISYSLYLWHWPLIVFQVAGLNLVKGLSTSQQNWFTFALSIVLATLSWRFIERPFRRDRKGIPPSRVFLAFGVSAAIPAVAAGIFMLLNGVPSRFPPKIVEIAAYLDHSDTRRRYRTGTCFLTDESPFRNFDKSVCLPHSDTKPNYLLFGDSHAAHLRYGLISVFPEINFLQATESSCKPMAYEAKRRAPQCTQMRNFVLNEYLPQKPATVVIIGGHWEGESDLPGIEATVHTVQSLGMTPVLIGPVIEYDDSFPQLLAMSIQRSQPNFAQQHKNEATRRLDQKMGDMARNKLHIKYFSYYDSLCANNQCIEYAAPGVPIEEDASHLTGQGSILVAEKIKELGLLP